MSLEQCCHNCYTKLKRHLEPAMTTLKLKAVGNSTGVILPKEVLSKLRVEQGDSLHVIETERGIELTPYDPEFERQMETARKIMKKRRGVLRELAK